MDSPASYPILATLIGKRPLVYLDNAATTQKPQEILQCELAYYEKLNSAFVGCGTIFTKYTGSGGKGSTNDANPEFIAWLRAAMEKYGVVWQSAELGKVDAGGGGTVAKHIAQHNIETIDLGVAVISMHAPYEVVSKVDVYETHRAINAFYCFNR